jgi:hypothetical protein
MSSPTAPADPASCGPPPGRFWPSRARALFPQVLPALLIGIGRPEMLIPEQNAGVPRDGAVAA